MPELPEVEQFRQMLLPLVSDSLHVTLSLMKENPPKVWLSEAQVQAISLNFCCFDVLRKGKQLCVALRSVKDMSKKMYLFLHMGMTGSIRSPDRESGWGHGDTKVAEIEYPPKYTYLTISTAKYQVAFSDPRKFGKAFLADNLDSFDLLAPDALTCKDKDVIEQRVIPGLTEKSRGIKAILLDQNRVCSGVGNWVADEVLYQTCMHPDQQWLASEQAEQLFEKLQSVVSIAVDCLLKGVKYPDDWLFGYRWTKKKAGKDYAGRSLTFLTSGGRTSAIVASRQKRYKKRIKKPPQARKGSTCTEDLPKQTKSKAESAGLVTEKKRQATTTSVRRSTRRRMSVRK